MVYDGNYGGIWSFRRRIQCGLRRSLRNILYIHTYIIMSRNLLNVCGICSTITVVFNLRRYIVGEIPNNNTKQHTGSSIVPCTYCILGTYEYVHMYVLRHYKPICCSGQLS